MTYQWQEIVPRIQSIVKDQVTGNRKQRYSDADLIHWWNTAQIRLSTMIPREQHWTYHDDNGLAEASLPKNFYRMTALLDSGHNLLPRLGVPSVLRPQGGYLLYENKLQFINIRPVTVYMVYQGYYPDIEGDTSPILVPRWAIEACGMYVAMNVAIKESMADARFRKLASGDDIPGNPQHNPFLPVAKWLEARFFEIVRAHADDPGYRNH